MILTVRHVTRYRFSSPARGVVQQHRLTPSRFDGQRVIDWQVEMPGAIRGAGYRDAAGDWVDIVSMRGEVSEALVTVAGTVETTDLTGVLKGTREKARPGLYMSATRQTRADASLRELSAGALRGAEGQSDLDRAHALSNAVADAIAYRPGETEAHTTAAEALEQGSGVCQDHAHALIAVAQAAGIPGRYVTGYLFADAEGLGHEASHAWAELWVPDLGWVGFDPSNRCCPDDKYIRIGSGFDAIDAAPIRGVVQGGVAAEALDVEVVVTAGQQQQQ